MDNLSDFIESLRSELSAVHVLLTSIRSYEQSAVKKRRGRPRTKLKAANAPDVGSSGFLRPVDFAEKVSQLRVQEGRLEKLICSLEEYQGPDSAGTKKSERRGRKFMGLEERQEVSVRMKNYWASRRKKQNEKSNSASPPQANLPQPHQAVN